MLAGRRVVGWGVFALTCVLVGLGGWLSAYGGPRWPGSPRHRRARLLPIAVGIGFALGLPATMAVGHAGPLALAALWIAVAALLPRSR